MDRFVLSVCADAVLHQFDPDRHDKPAMASTLLRRVETDRNAFFEDPCYGSLFALSESDLGDARALLKPGPRLAMLVLCTTSMQYVTRTVNLPTNAHLPMAVQKNRFGFGHGRL